MSIGDPLTARDRATQASRITLPVAVVSNRRPGTPPTAGAGVGG
jgi:hypothetical protein